MHCQGAPGSTNDTQYYAQILRSFYTQHIFAKASHQPTSYTSTTKPWIASRSTRPCILSYSHRANHWSNCSLCRVVSKSIQEMPETSLISLNQSWTSTDHKSSPLYLCPRIRREKIRGNCLQYSARRVPRSHLTPQSSHFSVHPWNRSSITRGLQYRETEGWLWGNFGGWLFVPPGFWPYWWIDIWGKGP